MYLTARPVAGTQLPCYAFRSNTDVATHVAQMIANTVRERNAFGRRAVLALASGSTVVGVYREIVRMHREEGLSLAGVSAFGLTEYFGLEPYQTQSQSQWLRTHFFDKVDIRPENIHVFDPNLGADRVEAYCREYEAAIHSAGGIDVGLLTMGRNGHIGFNEPFGMSNSRTRLATLDPVTRRDAASDFFLEAHVPTQAFTVGIGTILEAREIILMAFGENMAAIVREAAEGPLTDRVPATFLRSHPNASLLVDEAAAAELTGVATPWILVGVEWTDELDKRAELWLSEQTGKALLKLDTADFRAHNLHQLIRHRGPAQQLAYRVFQWMMNTIEHHPAGREPQRVLVFSPHPDDDVISMGGTIIRLVEDRHEVHIAYMTSGNIAVFDHDVQRVADLLAELNRRLDIETERSGSIEARVLKALAEKRPGEGDIEEVLKIKELIRWSEAKAAARVCGCKEENLHFLDLPFYRTGTVAKKAPSLADVDVVRRTIAAVNPAQIYVAGDLSDPHGTHRVCAGLIFQALEQMASAGEALPQVMLYRGAWQEWAPHVIDIAVPLSPRDVDLKKASIFRHESQKDTALFPGPDDPREFWQRAEDRNRHTADVYNRFGLPEYYAMEAFVRWRQ